MKTIKQTIGALLLFGFILGSVSCSKDQASLQPTEAAAPDVLRIYSWSEYFDEEVFAQFEEQTGIKIDYDVFEDTDEMIAKLRSEPGQFDVIVADDSIISSVAELRLIRPLDKKLVPNLANIAAEHLNLSFDPGNEFSVPYMWGTTLVAYRSDKISDPQESWDLLWNPELKGKAMVIDERFELLSLAKFVAGHPIDSIEPAHFADASAKIISLVNDLDAQFGSDADVRKGLDSGEVWAAMCYSGDAAMVAAENENVSFFIPSEGAPLWIDSFAIARDSNHSLSAHKLVNFMLEAKVAAANTNYTYYASPNKAALPYISTEILEDKSIYPSAEVREKCRYYAKEGAELAELQNRAWHKIQLQRQSRINTARVGSDEPE
ncbi:MAG: spermidine/putrescine transport system substrate-binding protein [Pseudoalteromonas tetraodonis]|jgi:spermidine/putrescine transport system substrate-binding protein